ncbi:MAG: HAD family hydrolase [Clostridiales bacterium]|nr:HAD family hydrolase [Clostridiales bacterium]
MKTSLPYKKNGYKACIFDLDGTVVNTLPTVHHYCNITLDRFGFSAISELQCRNLCRLPIKEFYHELLRLGGCPPENIEKLAPQARDYDIKRYLENPAVGSMPYEGVPELLQELKSRGIILGVLTNKPHAIAQSLIGSLYPGIFDSVTGQTPDTISKPDPRCLLNYIGDMGLAKTECLYVGDSDVDMKTAKAARVDVAAVTWGFQSREHLLEYNPEYVFDKPAELLKLF